MGSGSPEQSRPVTRSPQCKLPNCLPEKVEKTVRLGSVKTKLALRTTTLLDHHSWCQIRFLEFSDTHREYSGQYLANPANLGRDKSATPWSSCQCRNFNFGYLEHRSKVLAYVANREAQVCENWGLLDNFGCESSEVERIYLTHRILPFFKSSERLNDAIYAAKAAKLQRYAF
jgi:hypothetical protein